MKYTVVYEEGDPRYKPYRVIEGDPTDNQEELFRLEHLGPALNVMEVCGMIEYRLGDDPEDMIEAYKVMYPEEGR